jgi:16S rRNA (guanine1207-N2)-methyltransferase
VLLAGLPADDLLGRLPDAHGWCWHAGDQAALDARFAERSHFGVNAPEREFETAVVFLPKSKDLTDYILNALASRLAGRELYLVGEKRSGIEGAAKQLNPFGKPRKRGTASCGWLPWPRRRKPSRWKAWPRLMSCRWPKVR